MTPITTILRKKSIIVKKEVVGKIGPPILTITTSTVQITALPIDKPSAEEGEIKKDASDSIQYRAHLINSIIPKNYLSSSTSPFFLITISRLIEYVLETSLS